MSYLLDTNVLSEIRKREGRRNRGLIEWVAGVRPEELYLSVLVVGEVRNGIERVRGSDPQKAMSLESWLSQVESFYGDRILPITSPIAARWGRVQAYRSFPVIDGLLAATADEHGLRLVTRNTQDLARWPAVHPLLNPFNG